MIQRQQTLWLLLSTVAAVLSFLFPFVTGKINRASATPTSPNNQVILDYQNITASSEFLILVLTIISAVLSSVIIFLYKNRKQQMQLCLVGILVSAGIIVLYILEVKKLTTGTLALSSVLPFLMLAGYFLAFRNIRKDEKLIKSLDKLR